jgi:hypothetical protein
LPLRRPRGRDLGAAEEEERGAYEGQILVDMGGDPLMLHNCPVRCRVE